MVNIKITQNFVATKYGGEYIVFFANIITCYWHCMAAEPWAKLQIICCARQFPAFQTLLHNSLFPTTYIRFNLFSMC